MASSGNCASSPRKPRWSNQSPTIILFSKNHELNELDKLDLESKSSEFLKQYWRDIDSNIFLAEQEKKRSAMNYLNRYQSKKVGR